MKLIIILFFFCISNVLAQSQAAIVGNVKSSENEDLAGTSISFDTNKERFYTVSDTLGHFTKILPLGLI